MKLVNNKPIQEVLNAIPDLSCWDEALSWIHKGQQFVKQVDAEQLLDAEFFSIEWSDIQQDAKYPLGLYASENWRKFVLAVFLADLVSYTNLVDQVNLDRLLFVMHAFPQGFRTWWIKFPDQSIWPVGYTGWYPMLETHFDLFENHPGTLKDRMVVPYLYPEGQKPFLYLFNFSAVSKLKKTELTSSLMKSFIHDIGYKDLGGMACITVSEEGTRLAGRLGMQQSGNLIVDGVPEGVFVKRF